MKSVPPDGASKRARALRTDMTDAERALWRLLRHEQLEGHKFRRQVPIGRFIADFVCHAARLVIEVDGGQHDPSARPEMERTAFLQHQGYRVLRFWNSEVLANPEGVLIVIAEACGGITPTQPSPIKREGY